MSFHVPHVYRVRKGALASDDSVGNCGAFFIPNGAGQTPLAVIASDGDGWERVSVSLPTRCPTWDEMCRVRHIFWDKDDCVVQFHPPENEYVNYHPYCLHLWRPVGIELPRPPSYMIGPQIRRQA